MPETGTDSGHTPNTPSAAGAAPTTRRSNTAWLDDLALRENVARQAEQDLAGMLGYHEKLGLLSTFFAACYADGKVAVQELRALREVSSALGLENADVVKYLQRLW